MNRKEKFMCYPNSDIKIASPFFSVRCGDCAAQYWSTRPVQRCRQCNGANINCAPASQDNL